MEVDKNRLGTLYYRALKNFDDFGEFQLALSNAMTGRSYEWDVKEFERVLNWMVEAKVSTSVPSENEQFRRSREQYLKKNDLD